MAVIEELMQAQVIYMDYLLKKANKKVEDEHSLAFDPQGRVLTDITLTDLDYKSIVQSINKTVPPGGFSLNKIGMDLALGRNTTDTTTVSLDLSHQDVFKEALRTQLIQVRSTDSEKIIQLLEETPKGSIIALQQEFHFHLGLAVRTYEKAIANRFDNKKKKMCTAYQQTMLAVNRLVVQEFAEALIKATKKNSLDVSILNKALDKARETITPRAHAILRMKMQKYTQVQLTVDDLKLLKPMAQQTSSTPNDVLHTDSSLGLVSLISGSEHTAHHRIQGTEFAHRQLIIHAYLNDKVILNTNNRIQIRTPSLDVKEDISSEDCIADVQIKLGHINTSYQLAERLSGGGLHEKPKAFIYNLYTAINHRLGDMSHNLQTQGAEAILQASHRYNADQLADKVSPVFCFVQNTLSYKVDLWFVPLNTLCVTLIHFLPLIQ